MKPLFIITVWVIFAVGNIFIAELNDSTRRRRIANKNPKQIEHFWYALGYCILCGIVFYISRNYWELTSLLLLRSSVFAVAYNLFSENPAFYISGTTNSAYDRMLKFLGFKSSEVPVFITFIMSLLFLIKDILVI